MKYTVAATLFALPFAANASELLGLSLRVGPSYPLDSDTRDLGGSLGFNAGLRYQLPVPGLLSSLIGATSGVDLEGFQAKDGSNKINYLGLTYLEQVRFASLGPVTPYAGFGVGAYRLGVDNLRTTYSSFNTGSSVIVTTNTVGGNNSGVRFGGRAMIGVELPMGLFTELSAVVTGKVNQINANTVNLAVGLRF